MASTEEQEQASDEELRERPAEADKEWNRKARADSRAREAACQEG